MESFQKDYAVRHADGLSASCTRGSVWITSSSIALNCPDGRLLLFEADVGMIVHSMDPLDMFPYKAKTMAEIFTAFEASLAQHARLWPSRRCPLAV